MSLGRPTFAVAVSVVAVLLLIGVQVASGTSTGGSTQARFCC